MKPAIYGSGDEVRLGDRVRLGVEDSPARRGQVVFVIERNEFTPDFPAHEWIYLYKGFMVKLEDGNLIHYETPEDDLESKGERGHCLTLHSTPFSTPPRR